jgi:S-adenosylmethionine:tRNA ribosyltransferase-isomerase
MEISDFEYDLPPELIAQNPAAERTSSRLLQITHQGIRHGGFTDVVGLLHPGDLLVLNDTRVIKARLFAVKDSGGQAEILVERLLGTHEALCQVRVSKPLKAGRTLHVQDVELICGARQGQFYRLTSALPFLELMETFGHVPLPPYIERTDVAKDSERYQTVYAREPGAVAAPTAGLHFSDALLSTVRDKGVDVAQVTLHVGAGTFAPVRGELDCHRMHSERYVVGEVAAERIRTTQAQGGRVVAVGTTVVRTLESAARLGEGSVSAGEGETDLFIRPGFEFQVVDALITNFHLPGSTLMMLVSAFAGHRPVMNAYQAAIEKEYRFFSYGDAMWMERQSV